MEKFYVYIKDRTISDLEYQLEDRQADANRCSSMGVTGVLGSASLSTILYR